MGVTFTDKATGRRIRLVVNSVQQVLALVGRAADTPTEAK